MKSLSAIILLLFIALNTSAQTARIAHRSHSGKNIANVLAAKDNWGLPTHIEEKKKTNSQSVTKDSVTTPVKKIQCRKCKPKSKRSQKAV